MLDILTIVHSFADMQTASRIRRTCRRLAALIPEPILYSKRNPLLVYEYRIGRKLHRLDGPARKRVDGYTFWYRKGIAHREYHPQSTGRYSTIYAVEGERHREASPSYIYKNSVGWYLRDKLHRKTGPACTMKGGSWFTLGECHRLDGTAFDNVYAIRDTEHCIFGTTRGIWIVAGIIIRGWFSCNRISMYS